MATQEAESPAGYSAQAIADNFVQKYFTVLYSDPDNVNKFYKNSSTITRPNLTDGEMSSASTMLGIKNMILSSEYHSCKAEIASIDAQDSCNDGIIVFVTGFLIGEGEMKRSFAQTFFLAPQTKGYFVLNDIFKFGIVMEEVVDAAAAAEVTETSVITPLAEEKQESAQEPDQQAEVKEPEPKLAEVKQSELVPEKVNSNGVTKSSGDKKGPVLKDVVVSKQPSFSSEKQTQEPPKMSYASMLAKVSPVNSPVNRSTNPVVVVAPSANSYLDKKKPSTQQAPPNRINNAPLNRSNNVPPNRIKNGPPRLNNAPRATDDGRGVYVGKLPSHCPIEELEKAFMECGPIRKDRSKVTTERDGYCYAIVEFESSDAARKALEIHTFLVGDRESYVTEKRSRVQGRGEYRNFDNNRRSRENSVEGHRDQNGFRGGYYGHNRNNRNDSQFQNRGANDFSSQTNWRNGGGEQHKNEGARQAPPTSDV